MQENYLFLGSAQSRCKNKVLEKSTYKFTRTQTDCSRNENGKKFRLTKDIFSLLCFIQNYIFLFEVWFPKTCHTIPTS